MNFNDLTITSIDAINAFNISTGAYRFTLDELQSAKIANSQDESDITGKNGRLLSTLKRNKTVTISGTNGLVSGGLLEVQTGGEFATQDKATVRWTDYLTIKSNKATTEFKAIGTTGAEIIALNIKNADSTIGKALVQDATAGEGKFAYDPSTKEITFKTSDYEDGTEIVVIYDRNIKADVLDNYSDVYSEKCKLYIDATAEDKCGLEYRVQFYISKADFSGTFDIDMGDNQTVHAFEAKSQASACGGNGKLWTYTVFGANAADAA